MDEKKYGSGAASLFSSAARDPQMAYAIRPMTGEVIIVKFGEDGFYPTDYGVQSSEWVKEQNEKLGIDEATAEAMAMCSMFGNWERFESIRDGMKQAMLMNDLNNTVEKFGEFIAETRQMLGGK
ncbi:MAG: hypothetical protein ACOYZ6_07910 [Chloroflexota bacterium]